MTNHLTEEQLVLYYYGDTLDAGEHLGECEQCRASYQTLQRVLNSVDSFPVPERGPDYEARVWSAIEGKMARRPAILRWLHWGTVLGKPALAAAAMVVLIVGAFVAGRFSHKPPVIKPLLADNGVRERVLLVAVGDHLERSQMVLVELVNAGAPSAGHLDISNEQRTAEDLLESNRLYRQTAASNGDVATASLLEDLERVLLEIAHSPSELSGRQLEDLRKQIEDRGILFKVKVFGSQVEQREAAPQPAANGNSL